MFVRMIVLRGFVAGGADDSIVGGSNLGDEVGLGFVVQEALGERGFELPHQAFSRELATVGRQVHLDGFQILLSEREQVQDVIISKRVLGAGRQRTNVAELGEGGHGGILQLIFDTRKGS